MIHGYVDYSLVHYWDELKKVIGAFGDKTANFDIPDDSEWAAELIKEGFTLEFMKNALIKPVLSLRSKAALLDWWRKVEDGDTEAPLPPESEIFKSEHYSSFIFLFFKMATEVNVFAHLGKTLFTHMKESLFSDKVEESDEDDEQEETGDKVSKDESEAGDKNNTADPAASNGNCDEATATPVSENDSCNKSVETAAAQSENTSESEEKKPPKVVKSMYGRVFTLKD